MLHDFASPQHGSFIDGPALGRRHEIQNVGSIAVNLTKVTIEGAVELELPDRDALPDQDLEPGEVVLVVRNRAALESAYDTRGLRIASEYDGNLSNGGETLILKSRLGESIQSFTYSDDWYALTDGHGISLEIIDSLAPLELWNQKEGWTAREIIGGTPGEVPGWSAGGEQLPGDFHQDRRVDTSDAVRLLEFLFDGRVDALPCASASGPDAGNVALGDWNGDRWLDVSDVVGLLRWAFIDAAPHFLGGECRAIPRCLEACEP